MAQIISKISQNLTEDGAQTKTMECSRSLASAIQPYAYYFSTIHILLSLTAILGNSLILVALRKESSLHPPSKVLYRCLATTDLLVGLIVHPLAVIHWMSFIHEDWGRCRWTNHAIFIAGYALCSVSLLTMTAISADRLLALLLGLRYRQIVTVKRIHAVLIAPVNATFTFISKLLGRKCLRFSHLRSKKTSS